MKARFSIIMILLSIAVLTSGLSTAAPPTLDEPVLEGDRLFEMKFGDANSVSLLADLLGDDDPLVRERAALSLGATNNTTAMQHLRTAMTDAEPGVRIAAVQGAVDLVGKGAAASVSAALGAKEPLRLMAAMRNVRSLNLTGAAPKLSGLLSSQDPLIRSVALSTLTHLNRAAAPAALETLLGDASDRVRLRAAENALLSNKPPASLIDGLLQNAEKPNPPAVRAAALEALGKLAFPKARRLLSAAGKDSDPLVVRGAVRAYHHAAKPKLVRPFLNHSSPTVRLAAIRAAGDLKIAPAIERLFELMVAAFDEPTHMAGRKALRQIGNESVSDGAAEAMDAGVKAVWALQKGAKPAAPATQEPARPNPDARDNSQIGRVHRRNIASCAWILGDLKSKKAYDIQLKILTDTLDGKTPWKINSSVLLELVPGLVKIGDRRAVEPLGKVLKKCEKDGVRYLRAIIAYRAGPPYSEVVTGKIMQALGEFKAYQSVGTIIQIADTNVQGLRLSTAASYAYRTFPVLIRDDNRARIEACILKAIPPEDGQSLLARFHACKAAGKLKLQPATPALEGIVKTERPGRRLMRAAAWAIQEITGKTPELPNPRLRQGDWVIKKLSE